MKLSLKNIFISFFFFLLQQHIYTQEETSNWYFGNRAAIKFNSNNSVLALEDSQMNTKYGSASISSKTGELLFYTNGTVIYNKNHNQMKNGGFLASDPDVTQTSIIVPKPNNSNIYYLFTVKNSNDPPPPMLGTLIPSGLYYSVIDMSLNGGLGSVVQKNIYLNPLVKEKLTAVHSSDGESIWVISFGKKDKTSIGFNTFYSYKVSSNGVEETPVTSEIPYPALTNRGVLKASPNGKYLAMSNFTNAVISNFDAEIGKITTTSFFRTKHGEGMDAIFSKANVYGLAFSQDSKYVYAETIEKGKNIIFQLKTDEPDSREYVLTSSNYQSYFQLAKDGNIYMTTSKDDTNPGDSLSVIIPPKNKGETIGTYTKNVIYLKDKKSRIGLPNFIQSYFRTRILTEKGCLNTNLLFEVDTYAPITSATWDFGDGNTSNQIKPEHAYNAVGSFTVSVTITVNNRQISTSRSVKIYPNPIVNSNQKLIQCDVSNNGVNKFNLTDIHEKITDISLNEALIFYENESDAIVGNDNNIKNPTGYEKTNGKNPLKLFVRVINNNGCATVTDFTLESINVSLGNIENMYSCELFKDSNNNSVGSFNLLNKKNAIRAQLNLPTSTTLRFYASIDDAQTNNGELSDVYQSVSTTVWVKATESDLSCNGIEQVKLITNELPSITINDTYVICISTTESNAITLDGNSNNDRYEWKNSSGNIISQDQLFTLTTIGEFSLTTYKTENNIECSTTKVFNVIHKNPPVFNELKVNITNDLKEVFVNVSGESSYEFSMDNITFFGNSNTHTFTDVQPGIHTVYVKDIAKCEPSISKSVTIIGYPGFLTPNNDGLNDTWNITGVNTFFYKTISVQIFNRFGTLIYTLNNNNHADGWDGTYNGLKLPSNDYWFSAVLEDNSGDIIKKTGHFSLIRK